MISIEAYHGTDAGLVQSILDNGFRTSIGDEHWLGNGTYFFVAGSSGAAPQGAAVKWAIASAYDKRSGQHRYGRYAVLRCNIKIAERDLWDLTTEDGMKIFNRIRNGFMKKIETSGYRPKRGVEFKDGHLINLGIAQMNLPFTATKGNFYIKFRVERIKNIYFRLPNCTILAVLNPEQQVEPGSISCVVEKEIG